MGNVSGRKVKVETCGSKDGVEEEYMMEEESPAPARPSLFHHSSTRSYYSPLQLSLVPHQTHRCNEEDMIAERGIPTMITWNYDGATSSHVAVEGSWDNWTKRESLERSGQDFLLLKVLPSGIYHYRFLVDGYWRCSPEVACECDDMGNIYNILDLQDYHVRTDIWNNSSNLTALDTPSSPESSYNNAAFTLEDSDEKLPELPPILSLQQSPLDDDHHQLSRLKNDSESLEKPLPAILNHLHIQKLSAGGSVFALSTTQRFHSKFVTIVLYKPSKK